MKIGFIAPMSLKELVPYLDETENIPCGLGCTVTGPLVKCYLEFGHEVIVVTTDLKIRKNIILKGKNLTVFVARSIPYGKVRAFTKFYFEIKEMADFLNTTHCDIYHAHWSYEFALAALKAKPDKSVVTICDWPYKIYEMLHDFYRKKRLEMSLEVFDKGKYFTSKSNYMKNMFLSEYPDKYHKIVYNCIPEQYFLEGDKIYNKDNIIILCINNGFNEWKNTKKAMEAFAIIRKSFPKAVLHMFGNGHGNGEEAEKWAIEKEINDGMVFMGKQDRKYIMEDLKKASLLIHSSREESFGNVLVEAMASKTPVVAGEKSGAVPEVLEYGRVGVLADIDSETAIAARAIEILSDRKVWEFYSIEGFNSARNRFSSESVAKSYIEIYKDIIRIEKDKE